MPPGLVITVVIFVVLAGLLAFGTRSVRLSRRALKQLRLSGVAYLCLPEYGQQGPGLWVLSVDDRDVRLRRAWRTDPGDGMNFSKRGATIERRQVHENIAAVVDGVRITAGDGRYMDLAIYPDPTYGYSRAVSNSELDDAIRVLAASLG